MTWNAAWLDIIDQRISAAMAHDMHPATMASRDTTGPGGTATFDGSGLAVPVKVPASVQAFAGDRVGLMKFGTSDWVVVFCFTKWGESFNSLRTDLGVGSQASASFANMPGSTSFTLRKRYDETRLSIRMSAGLFANATAETDFAMRLDDGNTAADHQLFTFHVSAVAHYVGAGEDTIAGLPAGLYTITARWRTNTGTMSCNAADTLSMSAREVGPAHP